MKNRVAVLWKILSCVLILVWVSIFAFELGLRSPALEMRLGRGNANSTIPLIWLSIAPQEYHNKRIKVSGFLTYRYELHTISLDKTHAQYLLGGDIWVKFPSEFASKPSVSTPDELDFKYVTIEGVFDMENQGHLGGYPGAIMVSSVTVLKVDSK